MLDAYSAQLGIDSYRNFYILNGNTGGFEEGTDRELGETLEKTPNMLSALSGQKGNKITTSFSYIDFAEPIVANDGNSYVIYVKDSKEEVKSIIWMFFAIIIQAIFFGLIIAVAISFFLSRTITVPIENLTKGASRISGGDFSDRLEVVSNDEIGRLTQTFNNMAEVLKNTLDEVGNERNKLETVFRYLEDGVAAFTRDKNILHINSTAKKMLGIEEEKQIADFADVFPEELSGITFEEILSKSKKETIVRDIEYRDRILRVNFASFLADLEAKSDASAGGIIAVVHDVTEQQRLENSRKEFVANVSHELRTPLTSVKSYAETVLQYEDLPPEMLSKFMNVIINETDRMTRIVKDLLLLSRLDNKKMDWKFDWFDADKLVMQISDTMLPQAIERYHTLICETDGTLGRLYGDKERLEQVLINIISNAIKYTPDGGNILVRAKREAEILTITVKDNGIGIPKEEQPRLFERFYRVDKARSRERGGTGLGLAIAKEIVESHNGKITVESEVNKGTEITITLPCGMKEIKSGNPAKEVSSGEKKN